MFTIFYSAQTKKFIEGQIVAGKHNGYFLVLGYKNMNDREFVVVKLYCMETKRACVGELYFDECSLKEIA
jgi:hypothetical protein